MTIFFKNPISFVLIFLLLICLRSDHIHVFATNLDDSFNFSGSSDEEVEDCSLEQYVKKEFCDKTKISSDSLIFLPCDFNFNIKNNEEINNNVNDEQALAEIMLKFTKEELMVISQCFANPCDENCDKKFNYSFYHKNNLRKFENKQDVFNWLARLKQLKKQKDCPECLYRLNFVIKEVNGKEEGSTSKVIGLFSVTVSTKSFKNIFNEIDIGLFKNPNILNENINKIFDEKEEEEKGNRKLFLNFNMFLDPACSNKRGYSIEAFRAFYNKFSKFKDVLMGTGLLFIKPAVKEGFGSKKQNFEVDLVEGFSFETQDDVYLYLRQHFNEFWGNYSFMLFLNNRKKVFDKAVSLLKEVNENNKLELFDSLMGLHQTGAFFAANTQLGKAPVYLFSELTNESCIACKKSKLEQNIFSLQNSDYFSIFNS